MIIWKHSSSDDNIKSKFVSAVIPPRKLPLYHRLLCSQSTKRSNKDLKNLLQILLTITVQTYKLRGGPPPPIIFERLKLPQQIIYRRDENLSESPNHQKYWENILISRFYEQFSRNRRNLGHFRKFEKISNS